MHGYPLVKNTKEVSDDLLKVEQEFLYPAFRGLLKKGLLDSEEGIFCHQPSNWEIPAQGRRHQAPGKGTLQLREELSGISRVIAVQ